jgi:hypothetical protein
MPRRKNPCHSSRRPRDNDRAEPAVNIQALTKLDALEQAIRKADEIARSIPLITVNDAWSTVELLSAVNSARSALEETLRTKLRTTTGFVEDIRNYAAKCRKYYDSAPVDEQRYIGQLHSHNKLKSLAYMIQQIKRAEGAGGDDEMMEAMRQRKARLGAR